MKLKTVRCPLGVTEQDVVRFFQRLPGHLDSDGSTATSPDTQARCAVFARLKTDRLQHTTLRYLCPWGGVQFVSGSGGRLITVEEDGKIHVRGLLTSLAGLFLGLFRLLVAATTITLLVLKLLYMLQHYYQLQKAADPGKILALTLLLMRSATEAFVCLLLASTVAGDAKPHKLQTAKVWAVRAGLFLYMATNPLPFGQQRWYPMCYFPWITSAANYAMIAFGVVSFAIFIAYCLFSLNPWESPAETTAGSESAPSPAGRELESRHKLLLVQRVLTLLAACIAILGAASIGLMHLAFVCLWASRVDTEVLLGEVSACILCLGWSVWIARKAVKSLRCTSRCSSWLFPRLCCSLCPCYRNRQLHPRSTSIQMQSVASRVDFFSSTATLASVSSTATPHDVYVSFLLLISAGDYLGFLCCITTLWSGVIMSFICLGSGQAASDVTLCDLSGISRGIISASAMPAIGLLVAICSLKILVCVKTGQLKSKQENISVHNEQTRRSLLRFRRLLLLVQRCTPTSDVVKHHLSILSTIMALTALLAVFLALPLPWIRLQVRYSDEFLDVSTDLTRLSKDLDGYSSTIRQLTAWYPCNENTNAELKGRDLNRDDLKKFDTTEIIQYCSERHCQAGEKSRRKSEDSMAELCKNYCANKEFFDNSSIRFDTNVHNHMAKNVRGNKSNEEILLKNIVLEDKNSFEKKLIFPSFKAPTNFSAVDDDDGRTANTGVPVDVTEVGSSSTSDSFFKYCQDNEEALILFSGGHQQGEANNAPDQDYAIKVRAKESTALATRHRREASHWNLCKLFLCAAEVVSQVGLFVPFFSYFFAGAYILIKGLLLTLRLLLKANVIRVKVDDLSVRLNGIALYLNSGTQERLMYLSVSSYTMVYLAYPAVIAGCVGVLMGFWPRGDPLSQPFLQHRGRRMSTLLLPLLALNGVGIVVTLHWTDIIDYMAGYVSLFKVSSTTEFGTQFLLAAFISAFGSCLTSLVLNLWDARDRRLQEKKTKSQLAAIENTGTRPERQQSSAQQNVTKDKKKSRNGRFLRLQMWLKSKKTKANYNFWDSAVSWWLTFILVSLALAVMTSALWLSFFNVSIQMRPLIQNLYQGVGEDGVAMYSLADQFVNVDTDSCDLVKLAVNLIIKLMANGLPNIDIRPLINRFSRLKTKAEQELKAVPGLIVYPCLVAHVMANVIVFYGILVRLCGYPFLSPRSAALWLRRLSLLSMAWLINISAMMLGPMTSAASPVVAEVKVNVGPGFLAAVAAHLLLILASREMQLSMFAPAQ